MQELCANTASLNAHQRQLAEGDRKQAAINEEAARLMEPGAEFHPWTPAHVAEAMGEIAAAVGNEVNRISINLQAGNVSLAGAVLNYAIEGYWRRLATTQAEETIESSWNSCVCHGHGCRQCDDTDEDSPDDAYEPNDPKRSDWLDRFGC